MKTTENKHIPYQISTKNSLILSFTTIHIYVLHTTVAFLETGAGMKNSHTFAFISPKLQSVSKFLYLDWDKKKFCETCFSVGHGLIPTGLSQTNMLNRNSLKLLTS